MNKQNRGLRAMLTSPPKKEKPVYDFKIEFVLFKKEFSLSFKVNSKKE